MPKYSTGSGGSSGDGDSCEMCGATDVKLEKATVAGAKLQVCKSCAPHSDEADDTTETHRESENMEAERTEVENPNPSNEPQNPGYTISRTDSEYWEEHGTNYETDKTPYLVKGYADKVSEAREAEGYSQEELAEFIGADVQDIISLEKGEATSNDVGGSVIKAVEETLKIEIVDEF